MNIEQYIQDNYGNNETWFVAEVKKHTDRIGKVFNYKNYLKRIHKISNKNDIVWKKQEFETKKTVYNMLKNTANYHTTYTLGKPISLDSSENNVKILSDIYKRGGFEKADYTILNKVLKFGDVGEYVYKDNNVIKSHIIKSEDFYPVYSDEGDYIACIEHWRDSDSKIAYYTIYYPNKVERWNDSGLMLNKVELTLNLLSGLPIHYHNMSDDTEFYGESFLADIIPLVDDLEEMLGKLSDAIYTLSMNPIGILSGQEFADAEIPSADGVGYMLNLRNGGAFDFANAEMDYQNIKYYIDTLLKQINEM
ncbi:MAG: phage portal protein, partial [Ruminiclostridium sp.]